jgi:DNA-binding SARP family transcriptional activator
MRSSAPERRRAASDLPDDGVRPFWCRTCGTLALFTSPAETTVLMEAGRPLAILVYLALAPKRRAGRDHLCELIWSGTDLRDSRHSLRQALYRCRQATGGTDLVLGCANDLELSPLVDLDCLAGERAVSDGDLQTALGWLRGDFLEGFSLPESREFESWAESQRVRFRSAWSLAASGVAESLLRSGEPSRALELAEQLARQAPFDDDPLHLVMRSLVALGRHATAVARFQAHAELRRIEEVEPPGAEFAAYARELAGCLRPPAGPEVPPEALVGPDASQEVPAVTVSQPAVTPREGSVATRRRAALALGVVAAAGLVAFGALGPVAATRLPWQADAAGTYFNPKRGLEGTAFLFDPVFKGAPRYSVVIHGPAGWNRDSAFECFPTLAPQVPAARRAICWTLSAPPVTGDFEGTSVIGRDTLRTRFHVDASGTLGAPEIQDVSLVPNGVRLRWSAPPDARSFVVRLGALPFGGSLAEILVTGSAREGTLPRPLLEHRHQYQAVVFALGADITHPGPAPGRFDVSVHDWKVEYDSGRATLNRADAGDPVRR